MIRATKPLIVLSLALLILTTGCEDHKARIAMLEDSNQQLLGDLQNAREELIALRQANDNCQNDLSKAMTDVENLTAQLSKPAEDVPEGWTPVPGGAMIAIEGSVLFAPGKVNLRSGAQQSLEQLVNAIRSNYPDKDILVFGHTDNTPIRKSGWKDNYELSTERALAVVRWLNGRGLNPEKLVACGCGEYRPVVPNDSDSGRSKNRRVEIYALDAEVRPAT